MMKLAPSDAMNRIALAMSSGCAIRFSFEPSIIFFLTASGKGAVRSFAGSPD